MSDEGVENGRDEESRGHPGAGAPEADVPVTCPRCGGAIEPGARYCTSCAAPLDRRAAAEADRRLYRAEKKRTRGEPDVVPPWAARAGDTVAGWPRWAKLWLPLAALLVTAVIVALFVVAAGHTPRAAINRYLEAVRHGEYNNAYNMLAARSGKFGTREYFTRWQDLQGQELGRLKGFSVRPLDGSESFLGRLVQPDPEEGDAYIATLEYREKTYDTSIFAVSAGGTWPFNSYKVKLSEGSTTVVAAPLGAVVTVDGVRIGRAVEDEDLKEALSLAHFPRTLDDGVDYVRTFVRAVENSVLDVKRLIRNLDMVVQDVRNTLDRVAMAGVSWQQIVDAWSQVVSQSKAFASDVGRTFMHLYWMFGGGDDGSVRARYTRIQSGLTLENFPEGWHRVEVSMPGMKTRTSEFWAPEGVTVSLEPESTTENELKLALQEYFVARSDAFFSLDPAGLTQAAGGSRLEEDLATVADYSARGLHQASDLKKLEYEEFKVLAPTVATIETEETWDFTVLQGRTPVNVASGQKNSYIYTLEREGDGPWKVTESKVD